MVLKVEEEKTQEIKPKEVEKKEEKVEDKKKKIVVVKELPTQQIRETKDEETGLVCLASSNLAPVLNINS